MTKFDSTYASRMCHLEGLLGVNIDTGEPAAEAGVAVVPAHDVLQTIGLLQHLNEIGLESLIDGFYTDASTMLYDENKTIKRIIYDIL